MRTTGAKVVAGVRDAVLIAALIGAPSLAKTVAAADVTIEHGPFEVDSAELFGLRGTLTVEITDDGAARLSVSGAEAAVEALSVAVEGGRLVVRAPDAGQSVTIANNVTVVTGSGGTSNVTIGGTSASSSSSGSTAGAPLDLVLAVPAGTGLTLAGLVGDAKIGDLESDVAFSVVGGTVKAGAVARAALEAVGGGAIEVASVTGDLDATVTGDGRIAVAGGAIDAARITVTGAGTVTVDAPAETAEVTMVGGGEVRIASVATEPVVSRVGSGSFSVGAE